MPCLKQHGWDAAACAPYVMCKRCHRFPGAGFFDQLEQDQCAIAAAAIVQAWLEEVSSTEQRQADLQAQRDELQDTKVRLQHLFVATAAAARGSAVPDAAGGSTATPEAT